MAGQMMRYGERDQLEGYLALPQGEVGPGVLVLHAWWGLNEFFKSLCDRLAEEGYVAFAPDLYGGGQVATTVDEAQRLLDTNEGPMTGERARAAVRFLSHHPTARPIGIGVIGFSMGAAWALEMAAARPGMVRAVVLFYGAWQPENLDKARAAFLGHFASPDEWEPREGIDALQKALQDAGRRVDFHFYEGAGHWFFEGNRPDAFNKEAADLAWERTLAFLAEQLPEKDEPLPRSGEELMARVNDGWAKLQDAVAGLSPEQMTRPGPEGWSVKEHLAHIAFWERLLLESQLGGKPAIEVAQMDEASLKSFDSANAIVAERTRARSLDDVLAESRQVHEALVAKLTGQPFEHWMRPRFPDDPDERPLMLWIAGNSYGHYGEHAEYIRDLLKAQQA